MKQVNIENRRLSIQDMAERLGVRREKIEMWSKIGILHPVMYGNSWWYKKNADSEFFDEWSGYDLNSLESCQASIRLKKLENRSSLL